MNKLLLFTLTLAVFINCALSIRLLQQKSSNPATPPTVLDTSALEENLHTMINNQFAKINQRIDQFEFQLNREITTLSENTTAPTSIACPPQKPQQDAIVFKGPVNDVFEMGFVDKIAWQNMEKQVKEMSKEENKHFWTTMLNGIQSGDIQVLDD